MYNVFEENAAFFEAYKIQFEEHLQSVTRKLNEDMENLIPSISIINEMSETEKLSEYHIILKNFSENLKCFDDYIVWINKEEKLFKLPVSKYEMLEQIKNFIFPFENLIRSQFRIEVVVDLSTDNYVILGYAFDGCDIITSGWMARLSISYRNSLNQR